MKTKTMDLTQGPIVASLLQFTLPMVLGNMLQQAYNLADTLIVSHVLGKEALAAVGSSFTLMTFITSILLGMCLGSSALLSMDYGSHNMSQLKEDTQTSWLWIGCMALFLCLASFICLDGIQSFMHVPADVWGWMHPYLFWIFTGIPAVFLSNYFASFLRSLGNSAVPLWFLGCSALLNIVLDWLLVVVWPWKTTGAAIATVLSQYAAGIGLLVYTLRQYKSCFSLPWNRHGFAGRLQRVVSFSLLTCLQQSVMNFGILLVQGLVNSFGSAVMAAFAAAVKIDAFAYMPVQDFGTAFSTFIAQNYGAGQADRIRKGCKGAMVTSLLFCLFISLLVYVFAPWLMGLFTDPGQEEVIAHGVSYLRIEGTFYAGIGCLFLLYGLYRGLARPGMSVVLTVISLGTRVVLAYGLSAIPSVGVAGIWWSVPIGWFLADACGLLVYGLRYRKHLQSMAADRNMSCAG